MASLVCGQLLHMILAHITPRPANTALGSLLLAALNTVLAQPPERDAEQVSAVRPPLDHGLGRRAELNMADLVGEVAEAVKDVRRI